MLINTQTPIWAQASQRNTTMVGGYFFPEVCDGTVSHTVSFDRLGPGRTTYVAEAAVEVCDGIDFWADEEIDEGVLILRPADRRRSSDSASGRATLR